MALKGDLKYLNINSTYNTTIKQNYRQMESAFWSEYLPTVIGIIVPTYPPTTEVSTFKYLLRCFIKQKSYLLKIIKYLEI